MSKLFGKIAGFFTNRTLVGLDKAGNRYFFVKEELDGIMEWICWLNGQRKKAPTQEEMMELEARRERVRQNVALLKKEEMERNPKEGNLRKVTSTGQVAGPDLKSFIRQFPTGSEGPPSPWDLAKHSNQERGSRQHECRCPSNFKRTLQHLSQQYKTFCINNLVCFRLRNIQLFLGPALQCSKTRLSLCIALIFKWSYTYGVWSHESSIVTVLTSPRLLESEKTNKRLSVAALP